MSRRANAGSEPHGNDEVLAPLLESSGESQAEDLIAHILEEHAYWRVDRVLDGRFARSGLARDQRDDVRADILLKLVHRLRAAGPEDPIQDFAAYVSVVAFNTFDDFVRRHYPRRARLRNRIHYALRHDSRFSVWGSGGSLLCGSRKWDGTPVAVAELTAPQSLPLDLRDALDALFRYAAGPVELESVVRILAEALLPPEHEGALDEVAATATPPPGDVLERFQDVSLVWDEIRQLPRNQRLALLLHARDASGESVCGHLQMAGIAGLRQIAEVLELPPAELAALWKELPLDDHRIAAMLRIARQQVINLRRSARDRLVRRTRKGATARGGSE